MHKMAVLGSVNGLNSHSTLGAGENVKEIL